MLLVAAGCISPELDLTLECLSYDLGWGFGARKITYESSAPTISVHVCLHVIAILWEVDLEYDGVSVV